MPQTPTPSLQIWGRANSVNVQKVLWCLAMNSTVAYERIDAGMQFGRNSEADYLAMNPNGRVPTLVARRFRAVGIQFHHALSLPGPWRYIAALSHPRQRRAPGWSAGSTGH